MSTLGDLAAEILGLAVAALGSAPERTIVSHGPPVFDCCDLLAVHWAVVQRNPNITPPGGTDRPLLAARMLKATFVVTRARCVPTLSEQGELPSATALSESALALADDGWLLYIGLTAAIRGGALEKFPCEPIDLDPMQPVNPSGGCGAVTLGLVTQIDGG